MKKFIAFAGLFAGVFQYANAQQSVQVLSHTVTAADLYTPNKVCEKVDLKNDATPQVKLTNIKTKVIDALPPNAKASNSFEPDVFRFSIRKKPVAYINVPVYRKSGGKIEQLLSFDTEITEDQQAVPMGGNGQTANKPTGVSNSVLATGTWYKFAAPTRGVYKITYSFLQSMGINPATIDPAKIRLYGNGGTVLPEMASSDAPDDLTENAIFVSSTGNTFGSSDYILFYANGHTLWSNDTTNKSFNHTTNYYEDKSYYFLNFDLGNGKRIATETATGTAGYSVDTSDDYLLIENDSFNLNNIGKVWWGNRMNSINPSSLTQTFPVNLGAVAGKVNLTTGIANVCDQGATFTLQANNSVINSVYLGASGTAIVAATKYATFAFDAPGNSFNIKYSYSTSGTGAGYVDYIQLNYHKLMQFAGGQFNFRNWQAFLQPLGQNTAYNIKNANANMIVWEISDPLHPIALTGTMNGSTYTVVRPNQRTLREFVAFDGNYNAPVKLDVSTVANQNLHGLTQTDFLIIAPEAFLPAANKLADFHRQKDQMNVTVVQVDKIYNEFSSGGQDIAGIRNFIKMFYDRSVSDADMIKNVLFVGAASFDYKNRLTFNTNFVPTFETKESIAPDSPYSSDDFYAMLADGDAIEESSKPNDIGTGRIPAYTPEEADGFVEKVKQYTSSSSYGPWKNVVSYVADNIDANINHMQDCEFVDQYYFDSAQLYNVYKIYSDAYAEVITPSGGRYPSVNKAINDQIYNGTFLMSYSGHGSPDRWADEAILTPDDYSNWTNQTKLPVMVTATCDFGRFDDPTHRSAGAKLMINPTGGSIAMITTTEVVFNTSNRTLSRNYVEKQFNKNSAGKWRTLGEALSEAKNVTYMSDAINNHKYVVLGDPALTMSMPVHKVQTSKLEFSNNGTLTETDTIKALGRYKLSGKVTDDNNNVLNDFNGPVYVTIFDKMKVVQTVNPNQTKTPYFDLQTNIVAKAKGTVQNGQFSVMFVAPKDINYNNGFGKISYYANTDATDAAGLDTGYTVGGYNDDAAEDNTPPVVKPYIDDDKFRDGGVTGPNPLLYVKIYDENGINVSGTSIGHDLVGILDDDIQNPFVMNNYYQTLENDFSNGFVNFPLYNLPEGKHTLKVIAWDTYNNSGEGTVSFEVKNKDKGFISNIYNYPNPVISGTTFVFQHNQEGEHLDVTILIYSANGALVKTLKQSLDNVNNRTEIYWDGLANGDFPLPKGVYFYKLNAKTSTGISATAYQKLVMLR